MRLFQASRRYRAWLDRVSNNRDWVIGAAALTVFVEGSVKDRAEIADPSKPKTAEEIEAIVQRHPLVKYHGLLPRFHGSDSRTANGRSRPPP